MNLGWRVPPPFQDPLFIWRLQPGEEGVGPKVIASRIWLAGTPPQSTHSGPQCPSSCPRSCLESRAGGKWGHQAPSQEYSSLLKPAPSCLSCLAHYPLLPSLRPASESSSDLSFLLASSLVCGLEEEPGREEPIGCRWRVKLAS